MLSFQENLAGAELSQLCCDTRGSCGGERDFNRSQVTLGSRSVWSLHSTGEGTARSGVDTFCPPGWRTAPANPTHCPCQTWKIFCSSLLRLEAGELSTNVCSMVSMACSVCREHKGWWQSFGGPSHLQEIDLNSSCKGRTTTLPHGARVRPQGRQAAAGSTAAAWTCPGPRERNEE